MKQSFDICDKIIETESHSIEQILCSGPAVYTFLNPVSYIYAWKDKTLLEQFDGIFADGAILVRAIKVFYSEHITRRSCDMTSLIPVIFNYAARNNKSIYLVGSKQEEIVSALAVLKTTYPEASIAGFHNGYFEDEAHKEAVITDIVHSAKPDFLIVGMGIGKQEEFLTKAKSAGFGGVGFTCGGFIHQTAKGNENYYPKWVDVLNLRFLYRFLHEPHTRKRYIIASLVFPYYFIREWSGKVRRNS